MNVQAVSYLLGGSSPHSRFGEVTRLVTRQAKGSNPLEPLLSLAKVRTRACVVTSSCSAQIMKDKNSSRSCPFECRILLVVTVLSQVKAPSLQSLTHWGSIPSPPPPPTPDPSSVGLPLRRDMDFKQTAPAFSRAQMVLSLRTKTYSNCLLYTSDAADES